ncbi:hypothetical protein G6F35_005585 [Rhizopus arrhizus]|nr:hypothetical protein G6F35_005585 [Rhizopus arrhizus]
MPPARGTYNKIADPALTEDQLSEMDTYFKEFRKQLRCPACQTTTTFHRHGSSPKPPCQPQFTCTSCRKLIKAFEMYPTVCEAAQRTQPEPSPPSLVDNFPPAEPSSNDSQANLIQQLCATVEKLTSELSQARLEIQHLQARINSIPTPTTPANATEFPTPQESRNQPTAYPDAPWHNTARVNALKQPSPQQREQRRIQREAAAARPYPCGHITYYTPKTWC